MTDFVLKDAYLAITTGLTKENVELAIACIKKAYQECEMEYLPKKN